MNRKELLAMLVSFMAGLAVMGLLAWIVEMMR